MARRAVDLSSEELAALGANAASIAAKKAQDARLVVTGTVDFLEDGQAASCLAERHPSGAVTLLAAGDMRSNPGENRSNRSARRRSAD